MPSLPTASTVPGSTWKPDVTLAPMEGVTNFPMRAWMWLAAQPAALATPFLRATPTYPHRELPREFCPELTTLRGAVPWTVVPQVMAAEPEDGLRAAEFLLEAGAPFVELNCGCPSPTCVGKGAGSSLLRDPDEFHATVATFALRLGPGRLAVKMRTGFACAEEFPALLAAVAALPLARLTVHGRTRPDGYTGQARWDLIQQAASQAAAPVLASGDVVDGPSLAARLATAPDVAGVLVGRGALRNPWIFAELRQGEPVTLPLATLPHALAAFALLNELYAENLDALLALARDGLLAVPCGTDPGRWEALHRTLADRVGTGPTSRHTIGRTKLLWNYLRSSLPPPFFAPTVLRARDLPELLAGIDGVRRQADLAETVVLRHRPDLDWMYGGSARNRASAEVLAASACAT